MNNFSLL